MGAARGSGSPEAKSDAPRRVGLFGGSFDPVHLGHLHAAHAARAAFALDQVVFVPAARSPYKLERQTAPAADRLAMLERALRGEPAFVVSALELDRPGPSYTIDTLRALPAAIGAESDVELYLILGSDILPGLAGWREVRELLARAQPIVVHREGEPEVLLAEIERDLGQSLAARLRAGYLRLPPVRVSSTDLRAALERGDEAVLARALPPAVLDYVRARALYGVRA